MATKSKIAPHEGRELELVLNGTKPFATVEHDKDPKQFQDIIDASGLTIRIQGILEGETYEVWFTKKGNEYFISQYELLLKHSKHLVETFGVGWYQRQMGRIFGYTEEEIDAFIKGDIKCNCSKCKGVSYDATTTQRTSHNASLSNGW